MLQTALFRVTEAPLFAAMACTNRLEWSVLKYRITDETIVHRFLQIVSAATAVLLGACSSEAPEPVAAQVQPTRVLVKPLTLDRTRTSVQAVGTSRAIRSIELHPATSGEVDAVLFEPGQLVSKGDVLVELDQRDEALAVQLGRVRLADAERLYARYQKSGSTGAVLPTEIDSASTALESIRIELQRAQIALDDRTITAPFAGYVDLTDVDPGDRINPDTVITTLDDRSALLVSFEVPELLIDEMQVGNDVTLATWQTRGPTFAGQIVEIGSRIDPSSRTFTTRATVDNTSDDLRPGMSFRVTIDVDGSAYPVITETAVQWGADGAYVWSVDDGIVQRVPVRIVQRQQGRVLVDADIEPGRLIVVEGIQRMRDGIAVEYDVDALAQSDGAGMSEPGEAP